MKARKKYLAIILSLILAVQAAPLLVFAEESASDTQDNTTSTATESVSDEQKNTATESVSEVQKNTAEESEAEEQDSASESIEAKLLVLDENGGEAELEEIDEAEYAGFIFQTEEKLSKREYKEIKEDAEDVSADSEIEDIAGREFFYADSLETIEETVDPELIKCIEPNYLVELDEAELEEYSATPDDEYYNKSSNNQKWAFDMMNIPEVWKKGFFGQAEDGEDIVVAVLDTGVDDTHEDLPNVMKGVSYAKGVEGTSYQDVYYHGTFVSGIIGAENNNTVGVSGDMPAVKIYPIRIFYEEKLSGGKTTYRCYDSDIVKGIRHAADIGADVVNMSFGDSFSNTAIEAACDYAAEKGTILVASAGNDYTEKYVYPACYDSVICVGSVGWDRKRSGFSNKSDKLDVVAPGGSTTSHSIWSTAPKYYTTDGYDKSGYYRSSGTSFSAPQVAALAAMVKSWDRSIDVDEFRTLLRKYSQDEGDKGYDIEYGWGIVDFKAVYEGACLLSDCDAVLEEDCYVADGNEKRPAVSLTYQGEPVSEDEYTIEYRNNLEPGIANVVITPKGEKFVGRKTVSFDIIKPYTEADPVTRISGEDRCETARLSADKYLKWKGQSKFNAIVVASAADFPDALSGAYLARVNDAPILLVNSDSEAVTKEYIVNKLKKGGKVYILGGKAVISSSFESYLKNVLSADCVKRLEGTNRYETNRSILLEIMANENSSLSKLIVTTGEKFPDGISASAEYGPVLMLGKSLTRRQKTLLKNLETKTKQCLIMGGEASVNSANVEEIRDVLGLGSGAVLRLPGMNRYHTSYLLAENSSKPTDTVILACGEVFPDGLSAGPIAMLYGAPVLLVSDTDYSYAAEYVRENKISNAIVMGGKSRISDKTVEKIMNY